MWFILGYLVLRKLIGATLSEPHTSGKNGASVAFVKTYVEIQINGTSVMCSQKFTFKNWDNLQMLLNVCLSCKRLPQ